MLVSSRPTVSIGNKLTVIVVNIVSNFMYQFTEERIN